MGIEAGDIVNMRFHYDGDVKYRSTVRGMLTKFPGFTFSGLNTIQLIGNTALMSMDQYSDFMQDVYDSDVDATERFSNYTEAHEYEFVDGIPK